MAFTTEAEALSGVGCQLALFLFSRFRRREPAICSLVGPSVVVTLETLETLASPLFELTSALLLLY